MKPVRIEPEAKEALVAATAWYEERREGLGRELLAEIDAVFAAIAGDPQQLGVASCSQRSSENVSLPCSLGKSGGAGSRTHVKGPNRNEARRGLTHQTHEIVWTGRSRSLPRRPT